MCQNLSVHRTFNFFLISSKDDGIKNPKINILLTDRIYLNIYFRIGLRYKRTKFRSTFNKLAEFIAILRSVSCGSFLGSSFFDPLSLTRSALGPVEARRSADPPRRPRGRKPDAGAVRQDGGRQHQNEALDGGDLCAFNRQRQAVVQVEVTSFSPSSPSLLLTVAKVKWCGLEQAKEHKGLRFAACWHYVASSIPYQPAARFLFLFKSFSQLLSFPLYTSHPSKCLIKWEKKA